MANSRNLSEKELAEVLQRHFRRFVSSARLTQDPVTGTPVVKVEFADEQRAGR